MYKEYQDSVEVKTERDAHKELTTAQVWIKKINKQRDCEKRKAWLADARNAVSMFEAGEVTNTKDIVQELSGANIWHSNIETSVPALFNSKPIPDVRVRYGDADMIQRHVCDIIDRAASFDFDSYDFIDVVKDIVRQSELTGWGIPKIRYTPASSESDVGYDVVDDGTVQNADQFSTVRDELEIECWPYDRLILGPSRNMKRLPWMAFEMDVTLDELDDMIPGGIKTEDGLKKPSQYYIAASSRQRKEGESEKDSDPKAEDAGIFPTFKIYQVWCKKDRKVYLVSPHETNFILRVIDDPLKLQNFYPVPKILYSKRMTNSVQPISPWKVYKGLFKEFEDITQRINALISQVRVRGLYDKQLEADFERLKDCQDFEYVPVSDVTVFMKAGGRGIVDAVLHWPLAEMITSIEKLVDQRERIKQLIFETTGLADIMRGATDPSETLGAQKIKTQWGTQRIQDRQSSIAEMVRDILRSKAEIRMRLSPWNLIKEITNIKFGNPSNSNNQTQDNQFPLAPGSMHFGAESRTAQGAVVGGTTLQPQPAMGQVQADPIDIEQKVKEAYRSLSLQFNIDIETDSTIRADLSRDQEQMNLFVTSSGTLVQAMTGVITLMPETRGALFKLYAAFARKFKLGPQGDAAIEDLIESSLKPMPSAEEDLRIAEANGTIQQLQQKNSQLEQIINSKQFERESKDKELFQRNKEHEEKLSVSRERNMIDDAHKAEDRALRLRELKLKENESSFNINHSKLKTAIEESKISFENSQREKEFEASRQDRQMDDSFRATEFEAGRKDREIDDQFRHLEAADRRNEFKTKTNIDSALMAQQQSDKAEESLRRDEEKREHRLSSEAKAAKEEKEQKDREKKSEQTQKSVDAITAQIAKLVEAGQKDTNRLHNELKSILAEVKSSNSELAKAMRAPKRVKRDADGRAIGIEVG